MLTILNYPPHKGGPTPIDALTELGVIIGDSILFNVSADCDVKACFTTSVDLTYDDGHSDRLRDTVVVLGVLESFDTDAQRVQFMQNCTAVLADDGWIYFVTVEDYDFFAGWTKLAVGPGYNVWTSCLDDNNDWVKMGGMNNDN